jgi:hypothetical protein
MALPKYHNFQHYSPTKFKGS